MDSVASKNKNSDGDKRINKYLENNKEKNLNKKLVRFQAHFLTEKDDQGKNILHLACTRGQDDDIIFFIEKA
jgi:ankyrin repeat protein